jgi:hypothetical protein
MEPKLHSLIKHFILTKNRSSCESSERNQIVQVSKDWSVLFPSHSYRAVLWGEIEWLVPRLLYSVFNCWLRYHRMMWMKNSEGWGRKWCELFWNNAFTFAWKDWGKWQKDCQVNQSLAKIVEKCEEESQ